MNKHKIMKSTDVCVYMKGVGEFALARRSADKGSWPSGWIAK